MKNNNHIILPLFLILTSITASATEVTSSPDALSVQNTQSSKNESIPTKEKSVFDDANDAALLEIDAACKKGLVIIASSVADESEYTESTSYNIQLANCAKKTIKYVWLEIVGYNPVDDPVIDPLSFSNNPVKNFKLIGPIANDESASYIKENMWFTDIVQYAIIKKLKIQYKDGTFKTILKPESLILSQEAAKHF